MAGVSTGLAAPVSGMGPAALVTPLGATSPAAPFGLRQSIESVVGGQAVILASGGSCEAMPNPVISADRVTKLAPDMASPAIPNLGEAKSSVRG